MLLPLETALDQNASGIRSQITERELQLLTITHPDIVQDINSEIKQLRKQLEKVQRSGSLKYMAMPGLK